MMKKKNMMCGGPCAVAKIAWILVLIGGLNWGLVGFFGGFNLIEEIFGATGLIAVPIVASIIYALVGISALYMIYETANKMKMMKK